jgi:stress-induced morphogen
MRHFHLVLISLMNVCMSSAFLAPKIVLASSSISSNHGVVGRSCGAIQLRASARPIYDAIERKLTEGLKPSQLRIVDNSHQHAGYWFIFFKFHLPGTHVLSSGHAGVAGRSGETHFEVLVVSEAFQG